MNDDAKKCFKCGNINFHVPEDVIGFYEFECVNCGTLNAIHVSPAINDLSEVTKVKLYLVPQNLSIEQLKVLRELIPELKNRSIVNLKKELDTHSEFYLGVFNSKLAELVKATALESELIFESRSILSGSDRLSGSEWSD